MQINVGGIGNVIGTPQAGLGNLAKTDGDRTNSQIFDDMLQAASGIYSETNTNLNSLEDFQLKIATGESDDFIGLNLMQSKASSSMQFFTQLTSKTVEAYREIMRIQI